MPFDRKKYPENWEHISRSVREEAGWQCEFCGAKHGKPHPETGKRVVLTVAHLDHNPQNCERENLRALCQRCHLRYDISLHKYHASQTRIRKMLQKGQLLLDFVE